MRLFKEAAIAVALSAALAAPSYAQSGTTNVWSGSIPAASARSDERASAVIRVIDADARGGSAAPVDTGELARARAAGELRASEGTAAHVLERIRTRSGQAAIVDARAEARTPSAPTRAELQATAKFDDVARSREHARYEADKRRRDAEQAREMQARAVEIQRSRASGEQRAQISWSASEQAPIVRVNPPAASVVAPATAPMDADAAMDADAGVAAAQTQ